MGRDARVMFVADAPPSIGTGAMNKDGVGEQLCMEARKKANLENAYCTYLVKCRFGSDVPTAVHFARCIDFLRREIEILRPQVVVTVGKQVRINDGGKVHALSFPNLIKEFLDKNIAVTWIHDPGEVFEKRKSEPALLESFYKQHADIPAMLH